METKEQLRELVLMEELKNLFFFDLFEWTDETEEEAAVLADDYVLSHKVMSSPIVHSKDEFMCMQSHF